MIRYSMPAPNSTLSWGKDSTMIPAIALKFFRDNVFSGNIHAMNSFIGTTTPNFFER